MPCQENFVIWSFKKNQYDISFSFFQIIFALLPILPWLFFNIPGCSLERTSHSFLFFYNLFFFLSPPSPSFSVLFSLCWKNNGKHINEHLLISVHAEFTIYFGLFTSGRLLRLFLPWQEKLVVNSTQWILGIHFRIFNIYIFNFFNIYIILYIL